LNNRFIDSVSFILEPADVSSEKMIPSIFKENRNRFLKSLRAVYSCQVHNRLLKKRNNLDKACLGAMVEGTQALMISTTLSFPT
jgi:hypothetical protein